MSRKSDQPDLGRRGFLRALGLGSALGLGAALVPGAARPGFASSGQPAIGSGGTELATLHDLSRCVGCGICVDACRETNGYKYPEPEKPFPEMVPARVKVEDWSDKREVQDRLTPYNWLYIQTAEVEYAGEVHTIHIPRRCMHCQNPPCANLCPWGAASRQPGGIVRINDKVCLGGSKCRSVCPWDIPQRQTGVGLYLDLLPRFAGNGVMFKCDRCFQLVAEGHEPACVTQCPFGVQTIGPREEIVARAHELAEKNGWFVYGEHENGGTNSLYVSPVPFEKLNAALAESGALDSKHGRPTLERYPNMMADEENLAWAALMAPVAGLAGGLLTLVGKGKNRLLRGGDEEDGDVS